MLIISYSHIYFNTITVILIKKLHSIHPNAVLYYLKMQVRSGGVTRGADFGNDLSLLYLLTCFDVENGTMTIQRCIRGVVLNFDIIAVTSIVVCRSDYRTVSRRKDRRSLRSRYIRSAMRFYYACDRIGSCAEA